MRIHIITHDADIDGMGPIVLAKSMYGKGADITYSLVNYGNVDKIIEQLISDGTLGECDQVFITDCCPKEETLQMLHEGNYPVEVIDHHEKSLQFNDKFDFCYNIFVTNGVKRSATDLFIEYFQKAYGFAPSTIQLEFSELTRKSDAWEVDPGNCTADDLAEYFFKVGPERYIDSMSQKLLTQRFFDFTEEEEAAIAERRREIAEVCQGVIEGMKVTKAKDGTVLGICSFDYNFRNQVSAFLRQINDRTGYDINNYCMSQTNRNPNMKPEERFHIDVMVLPDFNRRSVSFRTVSGADVNEIAKKYGGGGSKEAAGALLSSQMVEDLNIDLPENFTFVEK